VQLDCIFARSGQSLLSSASATSIARQCRISTAYIRTHIRATGL
jgi:hypothetical protein